MSAPYSHSVIDPRPHPDTPDLEYVVCDYCGAGAGHTLDNLPPPEALPFGMHRLGASALRLERAPIRFCACPDCGLVYMNPRLTEPAIARFYDKVYGTPGAHAGFESTQERRAAYLLDRAARLLATGAGQPAILDIGCGAGQILGAAQTRGWQVYGSELSVVAAARASERLGVPIHVGDFRAMDIPPASLDVVTILEVVEHLRAPMDFLRAGVALLKPGGVLVLEIPNIASLEYYVARLLRQRWRGFIIEHLYYFTPAFMRRLLPELGLRIGAISSRNPMSRLPNPFRDATALLGRRSAGEPAPDGAEPEPDVPPLAPVSLPRRVLRQANNYLLDGIAYLSERIGTRGNTLFVWARKLDEERP